MTVPIDPLMSDEEIDDLYMRSRELHLAKLRVIVPSKGFWWWRLALLVGVLGFWMLFWYEAIR